MKAPPVECGRRVAGGRAEEARDVEADDLSAWDGHTRGAQAVRPADWVQPHVVAGGAIRAVVDARLLLPPAATEVQPREVRVCRYRRVREHHHLRVQTRGVIAGVVTAEDRGAALAEVQV